MPSYDLSRERFRLSHAHLSVLGALYDGEPVSEDLAPAREELTSIGLVSEQGEISPVLADLANTLSAPVIQILIEATGPQGIQTHGVIVSDNAAFSHEEWPGTGESEYARIEPATVVFELARLVSLRQRAVAEARPEVLAVTSTMGALDAVLAALGELSAEEQQKPDAARETARRVLAESAPAMDPAQRAVFADLVGNLRANWRMTAAWPTQLDGKPGRGVNSFAVWDCGRLGYWERKSPAEPIVEGQITPETKLELVQVPVKRVWKMIGELLPNRDEIRDRAA